MTREHDIVQSVFEQIAQRLQGGLSARFTAIQFARGELFELDEQAIHEAWKHFSGGTSLNHAEIKFRLLRGEVQCMACFQKYHPKSGDIHCPYCGSFGAKILSGEEFYLESIE